MATTAGQPLGRKRITRNGRDGAVARMRGGAERWLEAERDQLILWLPVALGLGIAAWFALPDRAQWVAFLLASAALGLGALAASDGGRLMRALAVAGLAMALGCALAWWRAERVAAPVLARPAVVTFTGDVERVDMLPAREMVRVWLRVPDAAALGLPPRIRVNIATPDAPDGLSPGARLRFGARLMPPAPPAVPGAYDFAEVAWFQQLGATGKAFAPVEVLKPAHSASADLRRALNAHIQAQLAGSAGGIATALVTGDEGAISDEDAEAMRRAGLAHLLSVSGLNITAVTGATMFLVLRLLALFPTLALRVRLPIVAAAAGAVAAVFYTWLTGGQVPTVRACIAALLILLALSLGREAMTLRLVATGAFVVLLLWPESLVGPSFQLTFVAVTAIVALHEHPRVRGWFARQEEGWGRKIARSGASLLFTGTVVEFALMPIALYHFHKAGVYGALANIVAIPLTTFVAMPLEALALLFDTFGAGAPLWWLVGKSLALLIAIARWTAAMPGANASLPAMPTGAFALMIVGGLWIGLWRTRWRWLGALPFAAGAVWALLTPAPDLLVTGDGRHLALRTPDGGMAILRDRAGDYVRAMLGENAGVEGELGALDDLPEARCNADICLVERRAGNRSWRILATRSGFPLPWNALVELCNSADIVVSERGLPKGCTPRWLKLDRFVLARTGGVAIVLRNGSVRSVRGALHPWDTPPKVAPPWPERPRREGRRSRHRSQY